MRQRRQWQPTPVLLPGKSHGRRSLVGYSPWGCKESDRTERLHFHFQFFTKHPAQWMKYHDESLERCLPRKKYSPSLKRSARLWTFQQSYRKPEDIGEYLQNSEKVLPIQNFITTQGANQLGSGNKNISRHFTILTFHLLLPRELLEECVPRTKQ